MKKMVCRVSVALLLTLAFVGCGDSSDDSSTGGSGGSSGGSGGSSGGGGAAGSVGSAGAAGSSGTSGASGSGGAGGQQQGVDTSYEVNGTWYYLDAAGGDDANDGLTLQTAWQTMDHARDQLTPGDGVLMQSGDYGSFADVEAPQRDDYITFKADEGQTPVLTGIRARYGDPTDAYLRFDGVRVEVAWTDPGADPQQPDASSSTYAKTADPFSVGHARHIELLNASLVGTNKYLTVNGVRIENCEDVLIAGVSITRSWAGFWIGGSAGVTVHGNYVHEGVGSCVRVLTGNTDTLVSSNHCHDFNWSESDDYCTRGAHTPHGSAISVRSGDLTIRRNVFHDGWGSSGMMLYDCDGGVTDCEYSHVLIENNVLYDINNTYPLRIYRMGEDVVVRNNLLVGRYRYKDGTTEHTNDGRYYYESAMALHSIAEGYDASDLTVSGNVFVGILSLPSGANERHNIIWSYHRSGEWTCEAGEGSTVATCEYGSSPADYFESGFFAKEADFRPKHDKLLDFTPAPMSPAINAGDVDFQPPDSLGSIGTDGFIRDDGTARDADHHTVGPYEPTLP